MLTMLDSRVLAPLVLLLLGKGLEFPLFSISSFGYENENKWIICFVLDRPNLTKVNGRNKGIKNDGVKVGQTKYPRAASGFVEEPDEVLFSSSSES